MKLHTEEKKFERGGTTAEAEFTIKTTAKAFDILSSGLYSDPILAIIRELSCNAYDSHVADGNEKTPFKIHLPNQLEPFLSIRDFGTGLSDDDVLHIYTTYFESTKTDSNDYIGALGLGSKSPFSYASAFEVSSYFNGSKALYSIFLNESGIPSIARMGETPTDEHNGLEIKITVDGSDFYTFKDRTAEILKYFPTKPEVVGYPGFTFNSLPSHSISGEGWFVAPKEWSSQRFTAVQGNVPYRVDMSKINELLTDEENSFFEHAQIVAYFDIGDLEVAASREEIRYDDRSKQALVAKAREIRADLTAALERDIAKLDVKELWDAYQQLDNYSRETFGNDHSLRKFVIADEITNEILKSYVENDRKVIQMDEEAIKHFHFVSYGRPRHSMRSTTMPRLTTEIPKKLHPDSKIGFVVADIRMGAIKRTAAWQHGKGFSTIIMIKPNDYKVTSGAKTRELNKLIKNYGMPPVEYVSNMDNVCATPATKTLSTYFKFSGSYSSGNVSRYGWSAISSDNADAPKAGLYFLCSRGKTPFFGEDTNSVKCGDMSQFGPSNFRSSIEDMLTLINLAQGTTYKYEDVYGAPIRTLKALKSSKKWFNIFDLARKSLTHFKPDVEFYKRWDNTPDELGFKRLLKDDKFCDFVRDLDKDSTFRTLLQPVMKAYAKNKDTMANAKSASDLDYYLSYGEDAKVFDKISDKSYFDKGAFDFYPMLSFVGSIRYDSYNRADLNVLFDYIQLVDRS